MLSLDNIDFVKKSSKQVFHDSWKFKVTLPEWDITKLFNTISDIPCVDKSTVNITYEGHRAHASFEVTDQAFAEFMKMFIAQERGWFYTMTALPKSYGLYDPYDTITYKDILSSLSGLPTSASDKEHAEAIVKGDNKMSKVKTQKPTYYPSFMKFIKVIRSGPVTVAWIKSNKKVMIRKTKKDKDDLEKAMLMLFAKSQFDSEAAFHRWFRDQMKLFEEANNNAKN
jgi:hypothetical protein